MEHFGRFSGRIWAEFLSEFSEVRSGETIDLWSVLASLGLYLV